jgi:hypothetical protein
LVNELLSTPVVLLIYKRPETTRKVLEVLSKVNPGKLFIIADGASKDSIDEINQVKRTRDLIEKIDWQCDLYKNYSEEHLGLRRRVVSGLNWVFDREENAIILEDDCVPDISFFQFCKELLNHYSDDERIMVISGDNYQKGRRRTPYSFYFSRYNHCWGWATWKRAWEYYDDEISLWPQIRDEGWLRDIFGKNNNVEKYWTRIFNSVYDNEIESWAYRWTYSCWMQSGLTILPNVNLVTNIGFGDQATHTRYKTSKADQPRFSIQFPLNYPPYIIRDVKADCFTEQDHYGISLTKAVKRLIARILHFVRFI